MSLAQLGHDVVGIDQSADLVSIAKSSAKARKVKPEFVLGDYRELPEREFDLILLLHTTFGYFTKDEENYSFFCAALRHLAPSGTLLLAQRLAESLPAVTSVDETALLSAHGFHYSRVSAFSATLHQWWGAYTYESPDQSSRVVLPFRIHLYPNTTFKQWAESVGYKCCFSVYSDIPTQPIERMIAIKRL
jgi:SAM-dependent methyltransferase